MTQNQALPSPSYPFVGSDGKINPIWFQFLNSLWQRTGGSSAPGLVQSVAVTPGSGILSTVTNPTSNVNIELSLGGISPTSVTTAGNITTSKLLSATNGYFSSGIQFGAYQATTFSQTGYIQILDAGGAIRRLMVG